MHEVLGLIPLDSVELTLVCVYVDLFLVIGHLDTIHAAYTVELAEQN